MTPSRDIGRLIEIMAALRTPGSGCPWDLEQDFATIAPYTIEEAYEIADAIARGDLDDLRDELGDLLLQVVFHARMAEEQGAFDFGDVVEAITEKLVRRHPHVFGDARNMSPDEVKGLWDRIKAQEKAARAARGKPDRGGTARSPAFRPGCRHWRARSSCSRRPARSASTGTIRRRCSPRSARKPTRSAAKSTAATPRSTEAEIGDLLFAVVNLARHLDVDPDAALRGTNLKFERRFAAIERALAAKGRAPQDATLAEMDALWDAAKAAEKA